MSELKCCPFCGGEAEVGLTNQHDKLFVVGCNTPMCYGNINHFTMVFVSEETAIETWNTRTLMSNIVEKLEELKNEDVCMETSCTECKEKYKNNYKKDCYEPMQKLVLDKAINIVKQEIGVMNNESTNN